MSAFRPKVKDIDSRLIQAAYEQRSIARMTANGTTEEHAFKIMTEARRAREAKADQRRRAREFARQESGDDYVSSDD